MESVLILAGAYVAVYVTATLSVEILARLGLVYRLRSSDA
jgi:hypothetical protein